MAPCGFPPKYKLNSLMFENAEMKTSINISTGKYYYYYYTTLFNIIYFKKE